MNDLPDVEDAVSYDSETDTHRASFDSKKIEPSMAVVRMLASIQEKRPTELPPLFNFVDSDALDKFITSPLVVSQTGDREVNFTVDKYMVTVKSCGIIKAQSKDTVTEKQKC